MFKDFLKFNLLILVCGISIFGCTSNIKPGETVILFTTNAVQNKNTQDSWDVDMHGWIFETEEDSVWRSTLIEGLIKSLDLEKSTVKSEIFQQRLRMFLVDNERNKQLTLKIADTNVKSSKTGPNGHFYASAEIYGHKQSDDNSLDVSIEMPTGDERKFNGRVQLIPDSGVSVISDIDDTVKDSNVLDKKMLLKNTFTKEFKVVTGMETAYQEWASKGAAFHYVSSSPWQLYPSLYEFFISAGIPTGSFHLKTFRIKDSSVSDMFASPMETKVPLITSIIQKYPKRKFILVGDSGEKDPEVYAAIYKENAKQILRIFIRNVTNEDETSDRYKETFNAIDKSKWTVFMDPTVLHEFDLVMRY